MAHRIYDTEAIVVGGFPVGESNQYVALLTKELGLVRAVARNMRSERSKLRYALQKYSKSEVSLVRGKDVWRIVGAVPSIGYGSSFRDSNEKRRIAARISKLVERMHGEESESYGYDTLSAFHAALAAAEAKDVWGSIELLAVLRLLHVFGYVGKTLETEAYLTDHRFDEGVLEEVKANREYILRTVNRALTASQV